MINTRNPDLRERSQKEEFLFIINKEFKENTEVNNICLNGNIETPTKQPSKLNINTKQLFDSCTFIRCNFSNLDLSEIRFVNCEFRSCHFANCITKITTNDYLVFMDSRFYLSDFTNCQFISLIFFTCCFFKDVSVRNTILLGSVFSECCFVDFNFFDNCDISGTQFLSPNGCFDIRFINQNGFTKLNFLTVIGDVNHKEIGYSEYLTKILFLDCDILTKNGYLHFLSQLEKNGLPKHHSDCFFRYKKAEARTQKGIINYFWNLIGKSFGYGEKPQIALYVFLGSIFFFSILYLNFGFFSGEKYIKYIFSLTNSNFSSLGEDFMSSIYFSINAFFSAGMGDFKPASEFSKLLSYFEVVWGALYIILLTTTIVRRFTR